MQVGGRPDRAATRSPSASSPTARARTACTACGRCRSIPPGASSAPVQDLGAGEFGIDARPDAVARRRRRRPRRADASTRVAARQPVRHARAGRRLGAPARRHVRPAGRAVRDRRRRPSRRGRRAGRALVRGDADRRAAATPASSATRSSRAVGADGTLGAPVGPALSNPKRAFAPSAALTGDGRGVLVFELKTRSEAFATEAPVRARRVRRRRHARPAADPHERPREGAGRDRARRQAAC